MKRVRQKATLCTSGNVNTERLVDLRDDGDQKTVAFDESRAVATEVDVRGNDTTAVAAHNLLPSQSVHADGAP
jgi:hypothetical protein